MLRESCNHATRDLPKKPDPCEKRIIEFSRGHDKEREITDDAPAIPLFFWLSVFHLLFPFANAFLFDLLHIYLNGRTTSFCPLPLFVVDSFLPLILQRRGLLFRRQAVVLFR